MIPSGSDGGFAAARLRRGRHGRARFIKLQFLGSATSGDALREMRCAIECNKSGSRRRRLKTELPWQSREQIGSVAPGSAGIPESGISPGARSRRALPERIYPFLESLARELEIPPGNSKSRPGARNPDPGKAFPMAFPVGSATGISPKSGRAYSLREQIGILLSAFPAALPAGSVRSRVRERARSSG